MKSRAISGVRLSFAVMAGIPIVISYFGVKEKVYIPPKKTNYFKGLKIVFSDSKMRVLYSLCFLYSYCKSRCYLPALLCKVELHRCYSYGSALRLDSGENRYCDFLNK